MLNKPTAYEGTDFPYARLKSSRDFEKLLFHIFEEDIKSGLYQDEYDQVNLMQGVGERGRDLILYLSGKKVGVIQCKRHKTRISKPETAREIIRFSLNYLIDSSLISDINNFTYYLVAATGFSEPAIDLLSDFNSEIVDQTELDTWISQVINERKSFKHLILADIKSDLLKILSLINVEKITPENLNLKLEIYPHLLPLFFEVKKVQIIDDTKCFSKTPRTERPFIENPIIGREEDIEWLQTDRNDQLIIGQPGIGKTFSLFQLVKEPGAFFVLSKERELIASAISEFYPKLLIIDDAHTQRNFEVLVDILQLRRDLQADFKIVTSCWPKQDDRIIEAMNLPETSIRQLDLLTRNQIVEVIKSTGLAGPNDLIREIVNQAEGLPGLAVTLAQLSLKGGVRDVVLGNAISRSVLRLFKEELGNKANLILAAFSIGGDVGMSIEEIATELKINEFDLLEIVTQLSYAGVVLPTSQEHISVRPDILRYALVRDVFFNEIKFISIERLINKSPDLSQTTQILIGAKAIGANVPDSYLQNFLINYGMYDDWGWFVRLGYDEAKWVLNKYPEKIITVGRSALFTAPEITIPLLLERSIRDSRPLHSTPEHPLRIIQDWVLDGRSGTEDLIQRRNALYEAGRNWLASGKDQHVGLFSFKIVMSPKIEYSSTDPGTGNTWTFHYGYPALDEIRAIQLFWPKILELLRGMEIENWMPICEIVESWAYLQRVNVQLTSKYRETFKDFADLLLNDIVLIADSRPGVLHWASEIAKNTGLNIELNLDTEFEILFPSDFSDDWEKANKDQRNAVEKLAVQWSKSNHRQIIEKIVHLENEAKSVSKSWPRWTPYLCEKIAGRITPIIDWIKVMMEHDIEGDVLKPFLERAAKLSSPGWIGLAEKCLIQPNLSWIINSIILTLETPPQNLLDQVIKKLNHTHSKIIEILCLRNQVPEKQLILLLKHHDPSITYAAAGGEWHADPEGEVHDFIYQDWKKIILEIIDDKDRLLSRIFKKKPSLAFEWLKNFVENQGRKRYSYINALESAVESLNLEQRKEILERFLELPRINDPITPSISSEFVFHIVGNDIDLYQLLLSNKEFESLHLVPLSGEPSDTWLEKAKLALNSGYSPESIAMSSWASYKIEFISISNESKLWEKRVTNFEKLCENSDISLQEIGRAGKNIAEVNRKKAFKKERMEGIYGVL